MIGVYFIARHISHKAISILFKLAVINLHIGAFVQQILILCTLILF